MRKLLSVQSILPPVETLVQLLVDPLDLLVEPIDVRECPVTLPDVALAVGEAEHRLGEALVVTLVGLRRLVGLLGDGERLRRHSVYNARVRVDEPVGESRIGNRYTPAAVSPIR
jgi:hypothetical protein